MRVGMSLLLTSRVWDVTLLLAGDAAFPEELGLKWYMRSSADPRAAGLIPEDRNTVLKTADRLERPPAC